MGADASADPFARVAKAFKAIARQRSSISLNATDKSAAAYIRNHPGSKGVLIAKAIGVTAEHFRSRVFPKLNRLGFYNDDGYRPPRRKRLM